MGNQVSISSFWFFRILDSHLTKISKLSKDINTKIFLNQMVLETIIMKLCIKLQMKFLGKWVRLKSRWVKITKIKFRIWKIKIMRFCLRAKNYQTCLWIKLIKKKTFPNLKLTQISQSKLKILSKLAKEMIWFLQVSKTHHHLKIRTKLMTKKIILYCLKLPKKIKNKFWQKIIQFKNNLLKK